MFCFCLWVVVVFLSFVVDYVFDMVLVVVIFLVCIMVVFVVVGFDVLDGRGVGFSMRCGRGIKSQDGGESVNELYIEGKCWVQSESDSNCIFWK